MDSKNTPIVKLFIVFTILNTFHIASAQPVPAPTIETEIACEHRQTNICGDTVYYYIFIERTVVSQECCRRLINGGRDCHDDLTNTILRRGEYDGQRKQEIMKRQDEIWNLCKKNGKIDSKDLHF